MEPLYRWLFLCKMACYAIGYHKEGAWRVNVPMCYISSKLLRDAHDMLRDDTLIINLYIEANEFDYQQVIPGMPLHSVEITAPQGWQYASPNTDILDGRFVEPTAGKIIIDGHTIYANTLYGPLWTPVRPDMGAVDLYTMDGKALREAVAKNLGLTGAAR